MSDSTSGSEWSAWRNREIWTFFKQYTFPLLFRTNRSDVLPAEVGTAVGLRLRDRAFLLTAGHCVEAFPKYQETGILPSDAGGHLRLEPRETKFINEAPGRLDVGYFELPIQDATRLESQQRYFLAPSELEVGEPADVHDGDETFFVCGYPAHMAQDLGGLRTGLPLSMFSTFPAGERKIPQTTMHDPGAGVRCLDLWISGRFKDTDKPGTIALLPETGGMSGGGCWRTFVKEPDAGWTPQRLRIVGLHVANNRGNGGEEFARMMLVGHHLRLIAENYEELRGLIYRRWPFLEGWGVS